MTKVRPGLYISEVFCDSCHVQIFGPVTFKEDAMLCEECVDLLEDSVSVQHLSGASTEQAPEDSVNEYPARS